MGLFESVQAWVMRPLDDEPDLFEYAALTAVLVTVAILWTRVLNNIVE